MSEALPCTAPGCDRTYAPSRRKKTTMCARCATTAAARDPARRAKVSAGITERHRDPAYRAKRSEALSRSTKEIYHDPVRGAARRAILRQCGIDNGGSIAGSESAIRAGRTRSARALADVPIEYRDEYRRLSKVIPKASERKRIIKQQAQRDAEGFAGSGILPQQERERGER